jgi:2-keto-4-pentenoate hydratase/2-oxohepta-3-ene-1,7-dioic acid hydratase in catechol pathway
MKIAAFSTGDRRRLGVVVESGAEVNLADLTDLGVKVSDLAALWSDWPANRELILAGLAEGPPLIPAAEVSWLPPIDPGATFWAAAANYEEHLREGNFNRPDYPPFFIRNGQSLVGHGGDVHKPWFSDRLDYEGELAVVIGRRAHLVGEAEAADYIAGYTCFNDGSVRDWQRHTTQITVGKNFSRSGALGPWIATADDVPDVDNRQLETTINGRQVQSSPVGAAIWGILYVVSYLSAITELQPGDIVALGTPGGVGARQDPPLFLSAGDRVSIAIDGVGVLSHGVVEPPASAEPWPAGVR